MFKCKGEPVLNEKGEIIRTIGTIKDIHDQKINEVFIKKLEEENILLNNFYNELKKKNKEITDLTQIVSHDLKEPLRGISYNAYFLKQELNEHMTSSGRDILNSINIQIKFMQRLIDHISAYTRLDSEQFNVVGIDLNILIIEYLKIFKSSFPNDNIEIKFLKTFPKIKYDKAMIGSIFYNLINNAIKYNESEIKEIILDYRIENNKYIFLVKDNGIGIPEEYHVRIFKLFERLHAKDKFGGGTGFGLSYIKKVIERFDGQIWLDSEVNKGTTFYFSINIL